VEKVLDFIATTENISVINTSPTKSKAQQLLGGQLTLSQLKPGHPGISVLGGCTVRESSTWSLSCWFYGCFL